MRQTTSAFPRIGGAAISARIGAGEIVKRWLENGYPGV
jgi:hypothetical protein